MLSVWSHEGNFRSIDTRAPGKLTSDTWAPNSYVPTADAANY